MKIWLLLYSYGKNEFPCFNKEIQQPNWAAVSNELSNLQETSPNAFGVTSKSRCF